MTSNSQIKWPAWPVSDAIKTLMLNFHAAADDPSDEAAKTLVDSFTSDGEIQWDKTSLNVKSDFLAAHPAMWNGIKTRKHELQKVFVHDESCDDLIITGRITWVMKDGVVLEDGLIHRFVLDVGDAQNPKIKMFRGWPDSTKMMDHLAKEASSGGVNDSFFQQSQ